MIEIQITARLNSLWIHPDCEHELTDAEYLELVHEDIGALLEDARFRVVRDGGKPSREHWIEHVRVGDDVYDDSGQLIQQSYPAVIARESADYDRPAGPMHYCKREDWVQVAGAVIECRICKSTRGE